MVNNIRNLFNKRNITLIVLGLLCMIVSFVFYGNNKSKVFKDEYMKDIFVEEVNVIGEDNDNKGEVQAFTEDKRNDKSEGQAQLKSKGKIIIVEIKGEVLKPDVYEMEEGSILRDLIDKAGGLTSESNIDKINRASKLTANQLIVIPNKNDIKNESNNINSVTTSNISEDGVVNINTATKEELQKISGIGEVKANSIIEYREKNGGFKSIDEIKNIGGIGEKTYEKIKEKISI